MDIVEVDHDARYVNKEGTHVVAREYGKTPNGNPIGGRWVLRINGEWVDFSTYRNDLFSQYNLNPIKEQ